MLYAMGDLHLSTVLPKKMDVFGGVWAGYQDKIRAALETLSAEDTLLLCGDTSWGMNLEQSLPDFQFLQQCPARKLLLKGNHDYFWDTAAKMKRFFAQHGLEGIDILHNNAYLYNDIALCGTRGWFFEEERGNAHDEKMLAREVIRLRASLEAGRGLAPRAPVVFLHYPPLYGSYRCPPLLEVLAEYGVTRCYYGHLHGPARKRAIEGTVDGVCYRLISADHLDFRPAVIAEDD